MTGVPGQRYMLEHSANLTDDWADLQQVDVPDAGVIDLEMPVPAGSTRGFFRLRTPE